MKPTALTVNAALALLILTCDTMAQAPTSTPRLFHPHAPHVRIEHRHVDETNTPISSFPAPSPLPRLPFSHAKSLRMEQRRDKKRSTTTSVASRANSLTPGLDVSRWEGPVDMDTQRERGAHFVFVRASEGRNVVDPSFAPNWAAAQHAGLYASAYHYAMPDQSSGAQQALFFLAHGGALNTIKPDDGTGSSGSNSSSLIKVLPGMLDIEYNNDTTRDMCYGMRGERMVHWIRDWVQTYHHVTQAWPIIYTTADWWKHCTHNCRHFSHHSKLFVAQYVNPDEDNDGDDDDDQDETDKERIETDKKRVSLNQGILGDLFGGWTNWTFWQWAIEGTFDGDQDMFHGDESDLTQLAFSH